MTSGFVCRAHWSARASAPASAHSPGRSGARRRSPMVEHHRRVSMPPPRASLDVCTLVVRQHEYADMVTAVKFVPVGIGSRVGVF